MGEEEVAEGKGDQRPNMRKTLSAAGAVWTVGES